MKKTAAVLIALLLLVNTLAVTSFADSTNSYNVEPIKLYKSGAQTHQSYSFDTENFKSYLLENIKNFSESIDILSFQIPFSNENANNLLEYIIHFIPEAFNVNVKSGMKISVSANGYISTVGLPYNCVKSEYAAMTNDFINKSNKLLSGIKESSLTDYQKALIIHDRLINNCDYVKDEATHSYDAYGAIVEGKAVCQGYTLAYMYLLKQVGIESYFCNSKKLGHAWNIVKINNKYYHVDTTFDDPTGAMLGTVKHDFFLLSSNAIALDEKHKADDYDKPPSDTTFDNYFWKNSTTEFQFVNNNIYYFDNSTGKLNKWNLTSSDTTLLTVSDKWKSSSSSSYSGCYSKLSSDEKSLFYSTSVKIMKYDISSKSSSTAYTPTCSGYNWIYGFTYKDGEFRYVIHNEPTSNNTVEVKSYTYVEYNYSIGRKNQKLCYLCNGEICTDYSDVVTLGGKTYLVLNGIVNESKDSIAELNGGLYHIKNGEIPVNEEATLLIYNNKYYYFVHGVWYTKSLIFNFNNTKYFVSYGIVQKYDKSIVVNMASHVYIVSSDGSLDQTEQFVYLNNDNTTIYRVKKGVVTYSLEHATDPSQKLSTLVNMILGKNDADYLYDFSRDEQLDILDLVSAKKELASK